MTSARPRRSPTPAGFSRSRSSRSTGRTALVVATIACSVALVANSVSAQPIDPPSALRPIVAGWPRAENEALLAAIRRGVVPTMVVNDARTDVHPQTSCNLVGSLTYQPLPMPVRRFERSTFLHVRMGMAFNFFGKPDLAEPRDLITLFFGYRGQYRMEWSSASVPTPDSAGKCRSSTHYVRAATVGAFAAVRTRSADLPTGAYGWGVIDNKVPLAPDQRVLLARGNSEACRASEPECDTVLSIELVPIVSEGCRVVLDRDVEIAPGRAAFLGACDGSSMYSAGAYLSGRVSEDCSRRTGGVCTTAGVQRFQLHWGGREPERTFEAPGGARTYLNEVIRRRHQGAGKYEVVIEVPEKGGCGPDAQHLGPCRLEKGLTVLIR